MSHSPSRRKLKILCLHGFRTNGDPIMKRQISRSIFGTNKKLNSCIDFHYADGSEKIIPPNEDVDHDNDPRISLVSKIFGKQHSYCEWWNRTAMGGSVVRYIGLEQSVKQIIEMCKEEERAFDGILGFSQGGAFGTFLMGLGEQIRRQPSSLSTILSELNIPLSDLELIFKNNFHFCISVASFIPKDSIYSPVMFPRESDSDSDSSNPIQKIQKPVLVLAQKDDEVIGSWASKKILDYYKEDKEEEGGGGSQFLEIETGGHRIPTEKTMNFEQIDIVEKWIEKRMEEINGNDIDPGGPPDPITNSNL